MTYRCNSPECKHLKITYSDNWVAGTNADGTPSNICKWCQKELVQVEKIDTDRKTAGIVTAGCSGASKRGIH